MACKKAEIIEANADNQVAEVVQPETNMEDVNARERLLFGVDSKIESDDVLQNNITEFEWVRRNKIYPSFWGRNITGDNCLTKEEIDFLHTKACKIAAIYRTPDAKVTEEQGKIEAKKVIIAAFELGIPEGAAIFLEIAESENATHDFMRGFAETLITEGYTPGFKANTDAQYGFDREYSRGMQTDRAIFEKCLIWSVSPSLKEYERVTTTHLIHPDNWMPYAPSAITRNDIAIWQYGKECHPINDDAGNETTFNVNLVKGEQLMIEKMF